MLRMLPGLELLVKSLMGGVAENVLLLENISSSILVRCRLRSSPASSDDGLCHARSKLHESSWLPGTCQELRSGGLLCLGARHSTQNSAT